jgi:rare lipoprotein A
LVINHCSPLGGRRWEGAANTADEQGEYLSRFGIRPPRAAVGLVLAGAMALIGAQQALGGVAAAQPTQASVDSHDLHSLASSDLTTASGTVLAAMPTGQYEKPFSPPLPTVAPTLAPTVAPTPEPAPAMRLFESGIASTYGENDGFEGNRTACGQIFHTQVVQIAHKSLPCGTLVRVEDVTNGHTVDAQVTDRGPYVAGRVVDLSWGAFRQLDATGPGLLHVKVYVLQG